MTTATSRPCIRIVDSSSGGMFEVWAYHELTRLQAHSAVLSFLVRNPGLHPLPDEIIEVKTELGSPRLLVAAAMAPDGAGPSPVS